jgi:hypothetical protein
LYQVTAVSPAGIGAAEAAVPSGDRCLAVRDRTHLLEQPVERGNGYITARGTGVGAAAVEAGDCCFTIRNRTGIATLYQVTAAKKPFYQATLPDR